VEVECTWSRRLWFGPDDPVRAASAVCRFDDAWLIAQDDANHLAWWDPAAGTCVRVRAFPAVDGLDLFSEAAGTKHLKPDLEAGCAVDVDGTAGALLLGSGSLPARTRGVLVRASASGPVTAAAELRPLYRRVSETLGLAQGQLNLEGACVVDDALRWFQRGHGGSGVPSASIEVDLDGLLDAIAGGGDPASIELGSVRRHTIGQFDGLELAITDAVSLPGGAMFVSATAEDAPDAVADGPVAGSVLAMLRPGGSVHVVDLPTAVSAEKVEGLALLGTGPAATRLLAVVDADETRVGSLAMELVVTPPS
jgi:hypothetical protein